MKKIITFLTFLFFTTMAFSQAPTVPIDFESSTIVYAFNDFGGGVGSVIDNPQSSGINTSAKVGQVVKFEGEVFGGTTIPLAGPIDFAGNNAFTMKVYANRVGANVLMKLEGPGGPTSDIIVPTTVANEWEELTFSFTGFTSNEYNAITIIYDLGVVGDGGPDFTLLFDDIELATAVGGVQVPIDFESTTLTYSFSDFGGGVGSVIDNPVSSGINTSAKVGQFVKFEGEVFGGTTLALGAPVDFGSNNAFTMKVYANRVGANVLLKLEGPGGPTPDIIVPTTVANEWEELTFSFAGFTDAVYTGITIIYDLGIVGDEGPDFTLLFDDIDYTTAAAGGVQLPVTFESPDLTYNWTDFDGGQVTVIDNPVSSGINTSSKVGQMIKFEGAVFAGSKLTLGGPIDFGSSTALNMKVYANRVGANVLLKLEGPGGVATGDIIVPTTVANEWEELTFDVSGFTGNTYNAIVLIYELGTVGDGSADFTFWFDDIKLEGTSSTVDLKEIGVEYFPNPVNDFMTVRAQDNIDAITVFNLLGQPVTVERPDSPMASLDLSALTPGAYFISVEIGNKKGTARIIVQ